MIKLIKRHILIIASLITLSVPILVPVTVGACNNIESNLNSGLNATSNSQTACGGGPSANSSIASIAKNVINVFSLIVGIVSVFMIIYAGFRYITSGGDSGNTTGARNTLLYAIVGLILVAIAQIIVRFVIHTATTIQ